MTPKTRHIMRELRGEGMTLEAIGRGFGVSKEAVRQVLRYQPRPPLFLTDEERVARARRWGRNSYRRKCGLPAPRNT